MAKILDLTEARARRLGLCRKCRAPAYGRMLCAGCIRWHEVLTAHALRVAEHRRAERQQGRRRQP